MEVTQEMLERATKKAVELQVFPKFATLKIYEKTWKDIMQTILEAALTGGK